MRPATGATVVLLSGAMTLGTWMGGWWVVPVVAAGWGILARPPRPWLAGLAGTLAWGVLLVGAPWDASSRLAPRLGGIFHLPAWGMVALTLGFVWLLGWSAARAGAGLRHASDSLTTP